MLLCSSILACCGCHEAPRKEEILAVRANVTCAPLPQRGLYLEFISPNILNKNANRMFSTAVSANLSLPTCMAATIHSNLYINRLHWHGMYHKFLSCNRIIIMQKCLHVEPRIWRDSPNLSTYWGFLKLSAMWDCWPACCHGDGCVDVEAFIHSTQRTHAHFPPKKLNQAFNDVLFLTVFWQNAYLIFQKLCLNSHNLIGSPIIRCFLMAVYLFFN